jgi:hypothetical protein
MALSDVLPNRPLTFEEFKELQQQDTFDMVYTTDDAGAKHDRLTCVRGDVEYLLHYTEEKGWHQCSHQKKGPDQSSAV